MELNEKQLIIPKSDLNIKRKDLPNFKTDGMNEFVKWLKQKGIKIEYKKMNIKDVKPSQGEFNPDKIMALMNKNLDTKDKPAIMSSDNYIMDGHHRYAAQLNQNPDAPYWVYKIHLPFKQLIAIAAKSPHVYFKGISEMRHTNNYMKRYGLDEDSLKLVTRICENEAASKLREEVERRIREMASQSEKDFMSYNMALKNLEESVSIYRNTVRGFTATEQTIKEGLLEEVNELLERIGMLKKKCETDTLNEAVERSTKSKFLRGVRTVKRGLEKAGITRAVNARNVSDHLKTTKERRQEIRSKKLHDVDEEIVTELSDKTLKSYYKKADADLKDNIMDRKRRTKRSVGMYQAAHKVMMREDKVGHYSYKVDRMGNVELKNDKTRKSVYLQGDDAESFHDDVIDNEGFWKLSTNRKMAVLDQFDDIMEDLEQIDELNKDTLENYKKKAEDQIDKTPASQHIGNVKKHQLGSQTVLNYWNKKYKRGMTVAKDKPGYDSKEKLRRRRQGVETANKKLSESLINELSSDKLKDYEEKATKDFQNRVSKDLKDKKLDKRMSGIERAFTKRTGYK